MQVNFTEGCPLRRAVDSEKIKEGEVAAGEDLLKPTEQGKQNPCRFYAHHVLI